MGAFADSLFGILMSWVRALVGGIWALFSSERTTILEFLGKNWIVLAVLMIAAGLVIDWLIWLIRWQPYHIWAMRVRKLLRIAPPEEEFGAYEEEDDSAYMPPQQAPGYAEAPQEEQWLPLEQPVIGEEEAQQVFDAAEQAPDEHLYPGMRYDDARTTADTAQDGMSGTRRYAAVHAEGPGAAEVTRRRAEIDAWQLQMQEEARRKAEAERAARLAEAERERKAAQAAYEAEQARLAQEAYEAEQARLAQAAYEAEQARLAQEEYERQLAEYERQKAQYERDLAEYERQKAEYEAALAQQAAAHEAAQEFEPAANARRRRRTAAYSDYVEGEDVTELPAAPEWQPMQQMEPPAGDGEPETKAAKRSIWRSGMEMMAQMMEPEENDVTGIASLPPRVDMHKAYKPAKRPGEQ